MFHSVYQMLVSHNQQLDIYGDQWEHIEQMRQIIRYSQCNTALGCFIIVMILQSDFGSICSIQKTRKRGLQQKIQG